MNAMQLAILAVGGLAGWWVVSYLFDRKKSGPPPAAGGSAGSSRDAGGSTPAGAAVLAAAGSVANGDLSAFELGDRWPEILGVPRTATLAEIDTAYTARRAELGRRRYDAGVSGAEREANERALRNLDAAYQFVRAARGEAG